MNSFDDENMPERSPQSEYHDPSLPAEGRNFAYVERRRIDSDPDHDRNRRDVLEIATRADELGLFDRAREVVRAEIHNPANNTLEQVAARISEQANAVETEAGKNYPMRTHQEDRPWTQYEGINRSVMETNALGLRALQADIELNRAEEALIAAGEMDENGDVVDEDLRRGFEEIIRDAREINREYEQSGFYNLYGQIEVDDFERLREGVKVSVDNIREVGRLEQAPAQTEPGHENETTIADWNFQRTNREITRLERTSGGRDTDRYTELVRHRDAVINQADAHGLLDVVDERYQGVQTLLQNLQARGTVRQGDVDAFLAAVEGVRLGEIDEVVEDSDEETFAEDHFTGVTAFEFQRRRDYYLNRIQQLQAGVGPDVQAQPQVVVVPGGPGLTETQQAEAVRRGVVQADSETSTDIEKVLANIEQKDEDAQRRILRVLLANRIEGSEYSLSSEGLKTTVAAIESKLDLVEPAVGREIRARLHLHECHLLTSMLGSSSEFAVRAFKDELSKVERQKHLLDGQDLNVLTKSLDQLQNVDSMPGLPINTAYEILQQAVFYGVRVDGYSAPQTYLSGQNEDANSKVEEELIRRIELQIDPNELLEGESRRGNAQKTFELAEKLAMATFDHDVWLGKAIPGHAFAQSLYFYDDRTSDPVNNGPNITIAHVETLNNSSFFRYAEVKGNGGNQKLLRPQLWQRAKVSNTVHSQLLVNKLNRLESRDSTVRQAVKIANYYPEHEARVQADIQAGGFNQTYDEFGLNFEGADFRKLTTGTNYRGFLSYVGHVMTARELMLKDKWTLEDVTEDQVDSWFKPFSKIDPYIDGDTSRFGLRGWFAFGLLDSALREGATRAIGYSEFEKMMAPLTKDRMNPETGRVERFINRENEEILRQALKPLQRGAANAALQALEGVVVTRSRR